MKLNKTLTSFNKYASKQKQDNDDDETMYMIPKTLRMFHKSFEVNAVDVYFDEPIGPLPYYRELIHYMHNMEEHDKLNIWVDTPGGMLDTTLAIIDAMHASEGDVTVIVTGQAASAGSLIALSAPSLVLSDNARFFIHSASYGTGYAKQGDIEAHVEYSKGMLREVMTKAYKGFLTDDEISLLFIGKDYYFTIEESERRLQARAEYLQAQHEKSQTEAVKDNPEAVVQEVTPAPKRKK